MSEGWVTTLFAAALFTKPFFKATTELKGAQRGRNNLRTGELLFRVET